MKTLWTVWSEYDATGEGQTLLVWIGYASDASEARGIFTGRFGEFFTAFCTVEKGVVRNQVVEALLSGATLERLSAAAGRANIDAYAQLHVNAA